MSNKDENEHISNTVSDENSDVTRQQRGEVGTELENVSEKQENQQAASSENQNLVYFPDYEIGKRLRKPTEKGKSFQLEILSQKRQSCYRNLAKYLQSVHEALDTEIDLYALERLRDALDKSKEELNHAHNQFHDALESEKERLDAYNWFDLRDREFMECRRRLMECIQSLERVQVKMSEASSVKSGKSCRSESVASSRSTRSMRIEAAAKSARLRAEIEFLEHDKELRRLQLLKEVSIADAEEKAFKRLLDEEQTSNKGELHRFPVSIEHENAKMNPSFQSNAGVYHDNLNVSFHQQHLAKPVEYKNNYQVQSEPARAIQLESQVHTRPSILDPKPSTPETAEPIITTLRQLAEVQTRQAELSALLTKQHVTNHLPVKEPPTFNGNVFDYPAFITAFDSIICDNVSTDKDRLYFLNKYTVGQANEVVKGFLAVNSNNAY